MTLNDIRDGLAIIIVVALLVVLAVFLANQFIAFYRRSTTPALHRIAEAFEGVIIEVIAQVNRIVLETYEKTKIILSDADRLKLAIEWYDTLPNTIEIGGHTYPVVWIKTIVTKEVWTQWVQTFYGRMKADLRFRASWVATQLANLEIDVDSIDGKVEYTNALRVGGMAFVNAPVSPIDLYVEPSEASASAGQLVYRSPVTIGAIAGAWARVYDQTPNSLIDGWIKTAYLSAPPMTVATQAELDKSSVPFDSANPGKGKG